MNMGRRTSQHTQCSRERTTYTHKRTDTHGRTAQPRPRQRSDEMRPLGQTGQALAPPPQDARPPSTSSTQYSFPALPVHRGAQGEPLGPRDERGFFFSCRGRSSSAELFCRRGRRHPVTMSESVAVAVAESVVVMRAVYDRIGAVRTVTVAVVEEPLSKRLRKRHPRLAPLPSSCPSVRKVVKPSSDRTTTDGFRSAEVVLPHGRR